MRDEKQLLLDEIKDEIVGSSSFVLASYQKLTPDLSSQFRVKLREIGGTLSVVKKRVLIAAAKKQGIHLDQKQMKGHIGVVFAKEDPVSATKALFSFAKDNKENVEVIGGHFEGRLCNAQEMKMIAELPSKDEMRAQLLALFEAPMAQTLSVMDALLTSVIHCLENKSQQE